MNAADMLMFIFLRQTIILQTAVSLKQRVKTTSNKHYFQEHKLCQNHYKLICAILFPLYIVHKHK